MKIAFVQDFLNRLGGAERVLKVLTDIYPKAPIYTLLYDESSTNGMFAGKQIITSRLQKYPSFIRKRAKYFLPLIPSLVEEWNFSQYEAVVSLNTAFVHGIITGSDTRHIAYFHSPMRFAWDWTHEYMREQNAYGIKKIGISAVMNFVRLWDYYAASRPDMLIANSRTVQKRISKYYRRTSAIVYPPVDTKRFHIGSDHQDYFLIVSTLTPYKRVELAIQLFNKIGRRLVVIGDGPHRSFLETISEPNVEFLGFKPDEAVAEYMQNCRALIFPGEDDFGITPVEAMACGKPVIAYGFGGATETVIPGKTGELFYEPTVTSIEQGLAKFFKNERHYKPLVIRRHANLFSEENFIQNMQKIIKNPNCQI